MERYSSEILQALLGSLDQLQVTCLAQTAVTWLPHSSMDAVRPASPGCNSLQVVCNSKPSQFAYPPPVTSETKDSAVKVPTAVLSTTARAKDKAKKKEAEKSAKEVGA